MKREAPGSEALEAESEAASALFAQRFAAGARRVDRMFAILMGIQWVAAVCLAIWLSPYAWAGRASTLHSHVVFAVVAGGLFSGLPIALALLRPARLSTRVVIASGQMMWSALLIHLTGGRIETHFHVFGSLALVAFYRDARVLAPATIIVAADHFVRGLVWPESVYGVSTPEWWRFLEHAGWVGFIDVFLVANCLQGARELRDASLHQVQAEQSEAAKAEASAYQRRAEELRCAYEALDDAHDELKGAQRRLGEAARQAGVAELASGILHNVGNVLNSVTVTTSVLQERMLKGRAGKLGAVCDLLKEHGADAGAFFAPQGRGSKVIEYLRRLSTELASEREANSEDLIALRRHIAHIAQVVASQQRFAAGPACGVTERIEVRELVDDAIELGHRAFGRSDIEVVRFIDVTEPFVSDRHALLQVLVNLVRNAVQATPLRASRDDAASRIEVGAKLEDESLHLWVVDEGKGMSAQTQAKLFRHGFTTKANGHGFGLHACANTIRRLGGSISATSEGEGSGARFDVRLPTRPAAIAA